MQHKTLDASLESFGIDPAEYDDITKNVESVPDFVEWLEKTDGDVRQAFRLYGLGAEFPTPDEPENITAWWEWSRYDPANPETFKCAGCSDEFTIVEATGGNYWGSDILALSQYGHMETFQNVTDSSGDIYNYELPEYPESEYTKMCGHCVREFEGWEMSDSVNRIRFTADSLVADVNHQSHVAHRDAGYFELHPMDQKAVDALIQHEEPEGWVKVYPKPGDHDAKRAHIRSNIRSWLQNWGLGRQSEDAVSDYHFDFPSIVTVGIRNGMYVSGASLWVPDNEEAIEEAESWISGPASDYRGHR